jgi:hypothetical protein
MHLRSCIFVPVRDDISTMIPISKNTVIIGRSNEARVSVGPTFVRRVTTKWVGRYFGPERDIDPAS